MQYASFDGFKIAPMRHHALGLQWTASGYGSKLPTRYMIHVGKAWRRVYCAQYANVGSFYIVGKAGKQWVDAGELDAAIWNYAPDEGIALPEAYA